MAAAADRGGKRDYRIGLVSLGIEANRPTIEALLQYTHEHGLTDRRVKLEELFAPSTLRDIPLSEGQHV